MLKYLLAFIVMFSFSNVSAQSKSVTINFERNTAYDKTQLSDKFKKVDIWELAGLTECSTSIDSVIIRLGEIVYKIPVVENHNLVTNDFVVSAGGKQYAQDSSLRHFNSSNSRNYGCRISLAKNFILGQLSIDGEEIIIEQLSNFIKGADKNLVLTYNVKDEVKIDVTCGTKTDNIINSEKQVSDTLTNRLNGVCRVMDYAIAVDYSSFLNHGSSITETSNYILSIMNMVEGNYLTWFTDDLYYKISEILIFTSPQVNPWIFNPDIYSNLNLFSAWAPTGFTKPFDNASYWYKQLGVLQPVGLAWLNTNCSTNGLNTNVIREYGAGVNSMRCLVAHEIGHNFGCAHTTGFIMNPTVNDATTWAPESIATINNRIAGGGGSCLTLCNYTTCETLATPNVTVTDNGSQLIVNWTSSSNPTRVEYRNSTTGSFILVGTFNSPINTATINHTQNCNISEYFQVKVTSICPNANTGVPTIIVKQSIGGNPPTPTISIATNSAIFCGGENATFTATITNGGITPIYQWKVNGINVGANTSSYSTTTLNHNDIVTCVLTSSISCVTANNVLSNSISIALNAPISNFDFAKTGLAINFINLSTCAATYAWDFGDGFNSSIADPTHTYAANGIYNVCLTVTNINGTNQKCLQIPVFNSWTDNMNGTTNGNPNLINYQNVYCDGESYFDGVAPVFNNYPVIRYDKQSWIPKQGTIEMLVKVQNGFSWFGGNNATSATIFAIDSNGLTKSSFIVGYANGNVAFRRFNSVTQTFTDITATNTPFRFNEWHVISVSYGTGGTIIKVDGTTYATNTTANFQLNDGHGFLGGANFQDVSNWWGIYGFKGGVDKLRFSYTQSDWQFTLANLPATASISASANNICLGSTVTFTATTIAPTANYQWKKNGVNVGANTATFIDNGLVNGNSINCIITPTSGCFGTPSATSNSIIMVVNAPAAPVTTISASANNICPGTSVTFTATTNAPTANYQWKKNGINVGINSATYTDNILQNNDQLLCFISATSGCFVNLATASNTLTVNVSIPLTPTISITPSRTNPCTGENVTFTTSITNGGTSPAYQWRKNGTLVGSGATYSTNTLILGDVISCILTTSLTCVTTTTAVSNNISMTVRPIITPTISVTGTSNTICAGSSVTFTATTNITNPTYQWKVNGNNTGTNSSSFIIATLNNGDIVSCAIFAPSVDCYTVYTVQSNSIPVTVRPLLTPSVTISSSDADNILCEGQGVVFSAIVQNGGTNSVYQWKRNGIVAGSNSPNYSILTPNNNDEISCTVISDESCLTSNNAESNRIRLELVQVNPVITKTGYTLSTTPLRNGAIWQWFKDGQLITGATNSTYVASTFGVYTITETYRTCKKTSNAVSIETLSSTENDDVKIFPNPTKGIFYAQTKSAEVLIKSFKLYDVTGKLVFTNDYLNVNLIQFDISPLSGSIYFGIFETSSKTVKTKIIKQ